mgnify:CR=1 FL=1
MKRQIKLFDPIIDNNELSVLNKTLKSKFWADGSGSNQVRKFEEKFQKIIKTKLISETAVGLADRNFSPSFIILL